MRPTSRLRSFQMNTMSKLRRLKPTRSRFTRFTSGRQGRRGEGGGGRAGWGGGLRPSRGTSHAAAAASRSPLAPPLATHSPPRVMTVNGISVSSTRQLTVGRMKLLERCGTPENPSSRNGISNSRLRSLQGVGGGAQTKRGHPRAAGRAAATHCLALLVTCVRVPRRRHAPKLALPDVLVHALDKLVELAVDLVAPLALALLLLDLIRVVPGRAGWEGEGLHRQRRSLMSLGQRACTPLAPTPISPPLGAPSRHPTHTTAARLTWTAAPRPASAPSP